MLPGESGIEILKKIRHKERTADLPVIMLTARTSEYDVVKGLTIGADDYVTKPFGILELISRIRPFYAVPTEWRNLLRCWCAGLSPWTP